VAAKVLRLYLVRHAEAVDKSVDGDRPLTARGRKDARALAKQIRPLKLAPAELWQSKKARSIQTARAMLPALASRPKVVESSLVLPQASAKQTVAAVTARKRDIMLVGHEPHLGKLITYLLTGKTRSVRIALSKPSIVCFERAPGDKHWTLSWMLSGVALQ
jgi:phosphohistidine phosphatase